MEINILKPEESCFKKEIFETLGHGNAYIYEKSEYTTDRGILVYYRDCAYPKHGFPFPDAVASINIIKRILKLLIKYINPFMVIFRSKQIFKDYYTISSNQLMNCVLKEEYLCPMAREIKKMLEIAFDEMKLDKRMANIIAHILEYDDAYRFFLQDLVGCLNKDSLLTFKTYRLAKKVIEERCPKGLNKMIIKYLRAFSIIMLVPKIRKSFNIALKQTDWEKIKFDDCDRYWVLNRGDWKFLGKTHLERRPEWLEKNKGVEPKGFSY